MGITKKWSRNKGLLNIDPNQTGLVAGYNMFPRQGVVQDLSGNGNHGTVNGAIFEHSEIGNSMKFAANSENITTTYTGAPSVFSVSGWFNLKSSGQGTFGRLFSKGTDVLELFVNNSATDLNLRYENGGGVQNDVISGGYVQDLTFHIAVTYTSGFIKVYLNNVLVDTINDDIVLDSSALVIGNLSVNAIDGLVSNFKVFNTELTTSEIQAEYQAGAKAVNWKSDYGVALSTGAESSGNLSDSPARIISGTHKFDTDTIGGKTCKVIECTSSGIVQIPTGYFFGGETQAAHGSIEWWMRKEIFGFSPRIGIIAAEKGNLQGASNNSYFMQVNNVQRLQFFKSTLGSVVTLFQTKIDFVPIQTWNHYRITRNKSGEFTIYFNSILADSTGGSGINPVTDSSFTTSKYLVFDLDTGDKVAWSDLSGGCAITKYQGVV